MIKSLKKRIIKKAVKWALEDPKLARQTRFRLMQTSRSLTHLHTQGLEPLSVIDVGASDGRWSREMESIWPDADYHLVEANASHEPSLAKLCGAKQNFSYVAAAAGGEIGEIYFDASDSHGGQASIDKCEGMIAVPVTTLSNEATRNRLQPPYLIKLDTHGFEVPILQGAEPLLEDAVAFVIEVYNFTLADGALKFWEMCQFMEERGFRVADITEPAWRPHDETFWQADFVFLRADAKPFSSNSFRPRR